MKKILSGLISLVIFCSAFELLFYASVGAVDISLSEEESISERKTICTASVTDDFVSDEIIVTFSNSKSKELKECTADDFSEVSAVSVDNLTKYSTEKLKKQRTHTNSVCNNIVSTDDCVIDESDFNQSWLIKLNKRSKQNVLDCIKMLEQRDDVLSASPNYYYEKDDINIISTSSVDELVSTFDERDVVPNDYVSSSQWAVSNISLENAWGITTGSTSVRVGILDSGINGEHPDLRGNIISADMSLHKNFVNSEDPLTDPDGHGTLVAGVIGAKGNNGTGITGVCWNVSLISLRIAYYNSEKKEYVSDSSKACAAIDYARVNNIKILNYSYSGPGEYDDYETKLNNYDGLFVCSAGNKGTDVGVAGNYRYPAHYNTDNMICVANSTEDDVLNTTSGEASCYSDTYVDLAAPGTGIYSTHNNSYATFTGTSLSAPYVTGVAALIKSKYPTMSAEAIKENILSNVDIIPGLEGKVSTGGRLNAYKALTNIKRFTVTYLPNGGGGSMLSSSIIYGCPMALTENSYQRAGFTFTGWHAKRTHNNTWHYTKNGTSKWFVEGTEDSGYKKYNYSDRQVINSLTSPGKIVQMYAQWKRDYIIKFNSNHGTGTMSNMGISYGDTKQLRANEFEHGDEYYFHHWYAKRTNDENEEEIYCTNGSDSDWYTLADKPTGYTRVDIANGITINDDTFESVCDNDIITLYAYWQPRVGTLGDANEDGKISTQDSSLIQRYVSNQVEIDPDSNQWVLCDVNFDGNVTIKDSTLISKYVARIIDEFGE